LEPQAAKTLVEQLKSAEMTEFAAKDILQSFRAIDAWYQQ
jgi:hypothetical protein